MSGLTCPKCHGDMRQYERNGVHVDQCSECRGVFLDRGELERLIDVERSWQEPPAPPASTPPPSPGREPYQQSGQAYGHAGHSKPKKRRSFFEELFD